MERREKCFKRYTFVLFIFFCLWVFLQLIAPLALPERSLEDLSGLVVVYDNENIVNAMVSPWNFIYSVGDRLCHQKAERSFFINGNQMPFCSRCFAIWLGLTIGLGFMVFYTISLNEKFLLGMILGIFPLGVDSIGQLLFLWESTNMLRLVTGLLTGTVCGVAIGLILDEVEITWILKGARN
jgi:uncharacterized membrane protein